MYRSYTADMLKVIAESLGVDVSYRFAELSEYIEPDMRTGDEIAADIIERAGLRGK